MKHEMPHPEYVVFGKPALALVLCQIRFPLLPRFPEPTYVDAFAQAIRKEYPKPTRTAQIAFPILAEHAQGQLPSLMLWRFSTIDDQWSLVLTENALTLESRAYESFPEFADRFVRAVELLVDSLNPALQVRLGLRYINEFRMPNATTLDEWQKYIRPDVLGLTATAHKLFDDSRVVFSRQEFELGLSDGSLVIRHGLHFGTTVEAAEAVHAVEQSPAQGPFYLLDMDRSDSYQREIDPESIRIRLSEFNTQLYRFFRWAIREPLYRALEPQHGS